MVPRAFHRCCQTLNHCARSCSFWWLSRSPVASWPGRKARHEALTSGTLSLSRREVSRLSRQLAPDATASTEKAESGRQTLRKVPRYSGSPIHRSSASSKTVFPGLGCLPSTPLKALRSGQWSPICGRSKGRRKQSSCPEIRSADKQFSLAKRDVLAATWLPAKAALTLRTCPRTPELTGQRKFAAQS